MELTKCCEERREDYQGHGTKRDGSTVDPADTAEIDRLGSSGAASKAICKFRREKQEE